MYKIVQSLVSAMLGQLIPIIIFGIGLQQPDTKNPHFFVLFTAARSLMGSLFISFAWVLVHIINWLITETKGGTHGRGLHLGRETLERQEEYICKAN
jgi:cytochrome bd-type quinol oxidase subunit 2